MLSHYLKPTRAGQCLSALINNRPIDDGIQTRMTARTMTRTQALFAVHLVGLLFGTCGILGELIEADASVITWGRAACAIIVLSVVSQFSSNSGLRGLLQHGRWWALMVSGTMLAIHWATFLFL